MTKQTRRAANRTAKKAQRDRQREYLLSVSDGAIGNAEALVTLLMGYADENDVHALIDRALKMLYRRVTK